MSRVLKHASASRRSAKVVRRANSDLEVAPCRALRRPTRYTMAGLALCVSDLPEMRRLLRTYELEMLIAKAEPASIAAAVNELDRASIDRFKRNALKAACDLNWETEGRKFLALCDRALAAPPKHKVGSASHSLTCG
jgi:hypothetical protein